MYAGCEKINRQIVSQTPQSPILTHLPNLHGHFTGVQLFGVRTVSIKGLVRSNLLGVFKRRYPK